MRHVSVTARYEVMTDIPLRQIYDDLSAHRDDLPDNLVDFEHWIHDHDDVLQDYLSDCVEPHEAEFQAMDIGCFGDFESEDYASDYWMHHHPLQLQWNMAG